MVPPRLKEDLEREVDGAAALEQVDRVVEVDVVARGEHERALVVVPGALELGVTPLLDSVDLAHIQGLELCRRHSAALRRGESITRLFVQYDVSDVPFLGGFR